MKRPDQHVLQKRLHVNVAHRPKGQPTIRTETMHQPLTLNPIVELLLKSHEQLRVNRFNLHAALIVNQILES